MKETFLDWKPLVQTVRRGRIEPRDRQGNVRYMFWSNERKAAFISDKYLLEHIQRARHHSLPFVLIGAQHTGKNIFLNLVARGIPGTTQPITCIDENVVGQEEEELERFFGKDGVIDRNREALIHFDFMERAIGWNRFIEKFLKLAIEQVLERTDGRRIRCPQMRIVFGANYELRPLQSAGASLFKYLYGALSGNQHAATRRLEEQPERLVTILTEMLAALVIRREISEQDAATLESIPSVVLQQLREYSVPEGFTGLFHCVRDAVHTHNWNEALANTQLGKVFVAWGGKSRKGGLWLADKFRETGIVVEKAPESLGAGEWWPQIRNRISKVDFVVFTFCEADFDINQRLVKFKEWREAIEIEKELNRPLIFPVFLDKTQPKVLQNKSGIDRRLVDELIARQWFWVSSRTGEGFSRLHTELTRWFRLLRTS